MSPIAIYPFDVAKPDGRTMSGVRKPRLSLSIGICIISIYFTLNRLGAAGGRDASEDIVI